MRQNAAVHGIVEAGQQLQQGGFAEAILVGWASFRRQAEFGVQGGTAS
jgi:hypothetical protein